MSWFALLTQPRCEKKVTNRLQQMGIEVFCPTQIVLRQWSDRKKKVEMPLIPSYVFVRLEDAQRERVYGVPGVVRYLYWLGKPAVVRDAEIEILQRWSQEPNLHWRLETWVPGQQVDIASGPFEGKAAVVDKVFKNKVHLVLEPLGLRIVVEK